MDEELEAAIDEVGRDRVFAYARSVGWGPQDTPPKWVWRQIVWEIQCSDIALNRSTSEQPNTNESAQD